MSYYDEVDRCEVESGRDVVEGPTPKTKQKLINFKPFAEHLTSVRSTGSPQKIQHESTATQHEVPEPAPTCVNKDGSSTIYDEFDGLTPINDSTDQLKSKHLKIDGSSSNSEKNEPQPLTKIFVKKFRKSRQNTECDCFAGPAKKKTTS